MTETSQTREAVRRLDAWGAGLTSFPDTYLEDVAQVLAALSEAEERIKALEGYLGDAEDVISKVEAILTETFEPEDYAPTILQRANDFMLTYRHNASLVQTLTAERDTALARIAGMEAGEPWAWVDPDEIDYAKGGPFRTARAWGHQHRDGFRIPLYATPSAALARACTCHPSDNPPTPCAERFALSDCKATDLARTTINKDAVKRALSPAPTVK